MSLSELTELLKRPRRARLAIAINLSSLIGRPCNGKPATIGLAFNPHVWSELHTSQALESAKNMKLMMNRLTGETRYFVAS